MADKKQLVLLKGGVEGWNAWREANPEISPNLKKAKLSEAVLSGANLSESDLSRADLSGADLSGADLSTSDLIGADLIGADLTGADLQTVHFTGADLRWADLRGANLGGSGFSEANLTGADLTGADLSEVDFGEANLSKANFTDADLSEAVLTRANLYKANLTKADLTGADLTGATLVRTVVEEANLSGCSVFGTSVWKIQGVPKAETDLKITDRDEPVLTVDNLEVAQFIYLLLHNEKIRDVIDTIGKTSVLILGRFGERKHVLEKLRGRLRELGFAPIVFDFEKPASKTLTETVRILAGISAFVIADITDPKSVPQEAMAIIPTFMVPFVAIVQGDQAPWGMLESLWQENRDRVLEPLRYEAIEDLISVLGPEVVEPALDRRDALLALRREEMSVRTIGEARRAGE